MSRVIHFEIQADDIERARSFYEKTFGWEIKKLMDSAQGGMDYWGLMTGPESKPGINGGMYKRPKEKEKYLNTFDCTIEVENLDKAIESVKRNGGKIRTDKMEIPGVGWFAGGTDTEGNIFGMLEPSPMS